MTIYTDFDLWLDIETPHSFAIEWGDQRVKLDRRQLKALRDVCDEALNMSQLEIDDAQPD